MKKLRVIHLCNMYLNYEEQILTLYQPRVRVRPFHLPAERREEEEEEEDGDCSLLHSESRRCVYCGLQ